MATFRPKNVSIEAYIWDGISFDVGVPEWVLSAPTRQITIDGLNHLFCGNINSPGWLHPGGYIAKCPIRRIISLSPQEICLFWEEVKPQFNYSGKAHVNADLCEWDPVKGAAAIDGEETACKNYVSFVVGRDGNFRLCEMCAELPAFKRFKKVPIDGSL